MITWLYWAVIGVGISAVHALIVIPRLTEPEDGERLEKRPYNTLANPITLAILAVTTVGSQWVTANSPNELRPMWLIAGSALLSLIWVDALTTWLPTILLRLVTLELLIALLIGTVWAANPRILLVRFALGALASGVIFALLWMISNSFGFGDVRLAPLLGGLAGVGGSSGWYTALLASSLVGVFWGLLASRHPAPGTVNGFAYGPALWVGPYAAYLWQLLTVA
ncbi:MAG: hypothetical protein LBJ43_01160 [Propionibacteriaceae bacterium]|jgi:leader peptidase (prepilin peptidase)/N-methyltransferase|nr:hypothetical protein [Propionibacteriaceae bacterium]